MPEALPEALPEAAPEALPDTTVAILGLGLMGGSLALALRGRCARLLGVDPDPQARQFALEHHVVDQAAGEPGALLPQAGLVVLAAPVRAILQLVQALPARHPGRAVVLDLGSTKSDILQAMQALPERFDPLGGHPMCGKEVGSILHAEAGLFQGAVFALAALERTSPCARRLAVELVKAVGALPLWVQAEEHDRWAAAASHLPYLLSNALAQVTPLEAQPLIGPGFRSAARLAATPLSMMMDVLISNRENLLRDLQGLRGRLDQLEACLAGGDWQALEQHLRQGAENYEQLVKPRSSKT